MVSGCESLIQVRHDVGRFVHPRGFSLLFYFQARDFHASASLHKLISAGFIFQRIPCFNGQPKATRGSPDFEAKRAGFEFVKLHIPGFGIDQSLFVSGSNHFRFGRKNGVKKKDDLSQDIADDSHDRLSIAS